MGDRDQDGDDLFDEDHEAFLADLEETDRQAVQLRREVLPEVRDLSEPDTPPSGRGPDS